MKSTFPRIIVFILLVLLTGSGCQKEDELFWEISPTSESSVIQKAVNGIEFKFCLLNEKGEPSTVFRKGENFSFVFSFKNKMLDTIVITTEFISSNFFRVYRLQDNFDMGKPWTGAWCEFSGAPQEFRLSPETENTIKCPWVVTETEKADYPLCAGESKSYLGKGEYYSNLDLDFHFTVAGKERVIDNVSFKINFKIV